MSTDLRTTVLDYLRQWNRTQKGALLNSAALRNTSGLAVNEVLAGLEADGLITWGAEWIIFNGGAA